jgi:hypothetical protein
MELNQHILCYPIGLHHDGVCQSQLMRGRDQWVLIQAVIDHLEQDVRTIGSAGLLSLFQSLLKITSQLNLDMGIFFPLDGCARIFCST